MNSNLNETEQKLIAAGWIKVDCTVVQVVDKQGGSWRLQDTSKIYKNPKTGTIVCLGKITAFDPQQSAQFLMSQILQSQLAAAHQHDHDHDHEHHHHDDENCSSHGEEKQVNEEDIQTIVSQTGVDRNAAIQAMEQHGNVAEAITALQTSQQ